MVKEITYKGVYLSVHGYYEPYDAGDSETPPSGGYFELEKIMLNNTDITELLENNIEEIEEKVLYEIENEEPFDE